jgi:hypothetical protein
MNGTVVGHPPPHVVGDGEDAPRLDTLRKPRASRTPSGSVITESARHPLDVRAEQDLARLGGLLQPGGCVDREARSRTVVSYFVGDDLAGLDPDPHLESGSPIAVAHCERRPARRAPRRPRCATGTPNAAITGVAGEALHDARRAP